MLAWLRPMETAPRPPFLTGRRLAVGLVVLAGVTLAIWSFHDARTRDTERIQAEFERRTGIRHALIREVLGRYEDALFGFSALFMVDENPSRSQFIRAARRLSGHTPGALALEWVPVVPAARRPALEEELQRSYHKPEFTITEHDAAGQLHRAGDRESYLPIAYIEPLKGSESALGYDLAVGPTSRLLEQARATDQITLTPQVPLVQVPDGRFGVIMISPVRRIPRPGEPAETATFQGFVQAVFLTHALLERTCASQPDTLLDMLFVDASESDPARRVLYYRSADHPAASGPAPAAEEFQRGMVLELSLPIGGRDWRVLYRPRAGWIEEQFTALPWVRTGGVLLVTALMAGLVQVSGRRTELIQREVAARTEELRRMQRELESDIARRTAAEAALKASEYRLQAILDHNPNSIFVKDLAGRYVLVNRQHARLWSRPAEDFIGRTDEELFSPDTAARFREVDTRVLATETVIRYEVTLTLPGALAPTTSIVQKFSLRDADGRIYGLCGISTDITDRKEAEAELQESRRQLSTLITQLPGAAFRCRFDEQLSALFVSDGMLALTGYPAEDYVSGRQHIAQLTVPEDRIGVRTAVGAAIRDRRPFEVEYRIRHQTGQEKWVLVRGRPIYDEGRTLRFVEGLAIDVTALKHAEQEKLSIERKLLAAQKLESLGVLAGGIAHDFNNILTSVLANASLARHDAASGKPVERSLEQIENAARRAADLCQQMLAYAGKGKIVSDRIDLSELVRGTTALLEVTLKKNARLDLRLAPGLPPVLADPTQLRQIVMNLVINAGDAITGPAGQITVTTFARQADAALLHSALGSPDLPPGTYAGLEVRDNGSGMAAETIARIFEPFFTTKFSGRGLGLSAVLGIVQSHRGALFVESQPGQGSTFRLLLPATTGPAVSSASPFPPAAARSILHGTALIVDDEESVRSVAATVLELHGAAVLCAASGEEALELLRTHGAKVSVVLLDMTMPGIGGEETIRRMRMRNDRQPVILMSGYSETETMQRCAGLGVVRFIQKPFEIEALLAAAKTFLS
jgi:PAS domain S-box-containing protein